jgi:V/A-type H+-transporting ATPase subunit I
MAISPVKRIHIIAHRSLKGPIVELLQDLGVMEVVTEKNPSLPLLPSSPSRKEELERKLGEIRYCLDFLERYRQEKPNALENFFPRPVEVKKEDFLHHHFSHVPIYRACSAIEEQLNQIRTTVNKLNGNLEFLRKIKSVQVPLECLGGTRFTFGFLLEVPREKLPLFEERLKAVGREWLMEMFPSSRGFWVFLLGHRDGEEKVKEIFQELSLSPLAFPQAFEGTPEEAMRKIEARLQEVMAQRDALLKKALAYLRFEKDLKVAHDYYGVLLEREAVESAILRTQEAYLISGWAKEEAVPMVEESLRKVGKEWVLYHRDPQDGEDPPIDLQNGVWAKNFEVLTRLYGLPNYTEIDPTPFLSLFFFLFFGMCLGDVIYGIVLALLGFIAPLYLPLSESARRFFHMLGWGGVASVGVGIATGSWLGDVFDYLPGFLSAVTGFKKALAVIDPINNPLPMLVFSLALGIVQVLVGIALSFVKEWRRKHFAVAIMDHLSWFIFLVAIVMYLLGMTALGVLKSVALPILVGSALFLVATQGRSKKNPVMKVLSGILSLYGVVSYLGDVLSYSRLFALGLSSSIIAILARTLGMLFGSSPYIGWLIGLAVALLFNVFNLLMSGLGAFVHSARLQYVEFFTKFYENGGREFKPFGYKTKYIKLS